MKPILVCLLVLGNLIAATTHAKTWSCVVNKQPLSLNSEVTPWNEFIVGTIGVTTFTYTLTAKNDALYLKVDTLVYDDGSRIELATSISKTDNSSKLFYSEHGASIKCE